MSRQGKSARVLVPWASASVDLSAHNDVVDRRQQWTRSSESAAEAVADIPDGATLAVGGFGLCGIPSVLVQRSAGLGRPGPGGRQQQLRRGRLGARPAAAGRRIRRDRRVVRGREQGVRAAVPGRRARGGADPAGHARRASSCRRERDRRLLHAHRRGHAGGRRRAAVAVRRRRLGAGARRPRSPSRRSRVRGSRTSTSGRRRSPRTSLWCARRKATGTAISSSTRRARNFNPLCAAAGADDDRGGRGAGAGRASWTRMHIHLPGIFVTRVVALFRTPTRRTERSAIRSGGRVSWPHARADGGPGRPGAGRRGLREPRDRAADAGAGLRPGRRRGRPAVARTACSASVRTRSPATSTPTSSTPARRPSRSLPGASLFRLGVVASAMIRGGQGRLAILGAMQVSAAGRHRQLDDPREDGQGHGRRDGPRARRAAGRRADGARREGRVTPRSSTECTLPLTGGGVVDRIITDLAVLDVGAARARPARAARPVCPSTTSSRPRPR